MFNKSRENTLNNKSLICSDKQVRAAYSSAASNSIIEKEKHVNGLQSILQRRTVFFFFLLFLNGAAAKTIQ